MFKLNYKNKKGFVLMEAVMGVLLLSIVGAGVLSLTKVIMKPQKTNNVIFMLSSQVKEDLSSGELMEGCLKNNNINIDTKTSINPNIDFKTTKHCSLETLVVDVDIDRTVEINIPKVKYILENKDEFGEYPYVIEN